jgi:hypothetical protein
MIPNLPSKPRLLDDRLLVAYLVGEPFPLADSARLVSTSLLYFRACRAAVLGVGGPLSGPFKALNSDHRAAAVERILMLPDRIELLDPRDVVPVMVHVRHRHPALNLLNTEVVAVAQLTDATLLLSRPTANGQLASVLATNTFNFEIVDLP